MKRLIPLFALLLLFLCGCHGGGGIVGKWKVDPAFLQAHANDQPNGFWTGFASTFTFEFKADNTFKGSMTEGTYALNGNDLTMTTTKMGALDLTKGNSGPDSKMLGELNSDGKTLTLHLPKAALNLLKGMPSALGSGITMARDTGS